MICVKIKPNQQNGFFFFFFLQNKENAASFFSFFFPRRNPGTDPMISSQPSDKVGRSNPTNKYHAINSVYYIFSIQVYITFLSIQVHIVIHIVLLCLLGCILSCLRCWLILGHNFFFFFNLSNIHVT